MSLMGVFFPHLLTLHIYLVKNLYGMWIWPDSKMNLGLCDLKSGNLSLVKN